MVWVHSRTRWRRRGVVYGRHAVTGRHKGGRDEELVDKDVKVKGRPTGRSMAWRW